MESKFFHETIGNCIIKSVVMLSHLISYSILVIAVSCSRRHIAFSYWDKSENDKIENYEFVNGYYKARLFPKWAQNEFSFPATDIIEELFIATDTNSDYVIDPGEFKVRSDYFHFGFTQPSFEKWDKDRSGNLKWDEFTDGGEQAILKMWDFSGDKNLNQREMADGIFLTYDKNHDGSWDSDEFEFWIKSRLR